MKARPRSTRGHTIRVRPHIRRRNGLVDAPPDHSTYDVPLGSLLYGFRAFH